MADAWLCEVLAMLGSQGLVNDPGAAGTSWAGAAVGQKDMKQEGLVPLPCLQDTLCVRGLGAWVRSLCCGTFSLQLEWQLHPLQSICAAQASLPPSAW